LYQALAGPVLSLIIHFTFFGSTFWANSVRRGCVDLIGVLAGVLERSGWSRLLYCHNQRVIWLEKVVGLYDSRQEAPLGTILSVGVETDMIRRPRFWQCDREDICRQARI
jgi:hypothetical protein